MKIASIVDEQTRLTMDIVDRSIAAERQDQQRGSQRWSMLNIVER